MVGHGDGDEIVGGGRWCKEQGCWELPLMAQCSRAQLNVTSTQVTNSDSDLLVGVAKEC